jgi:hypothetical protein
MQKIIPICLVMLWVSGCVVPEPLKVTAGHEFPKEGLAFLDLPNTTRQEVLSTLGDPLLDVPGPGVFLYTWETTRSYDVSVLPDEIGHLKMHPSPIVVDANPRRWGLFIAYDERGYVTAHEIRKIGPTGLAQACIDWKQSKIQQLQ